MAICVWIFNANKKRPLFAVLNDNCNQIRLASTCQLLKWSHLHKCNEIGNDTSILATLISSFIWLVISCRWTINIWRAIYRRFLLSFKKLFNLREKKRNLFDFQLHIIICCLEIELQFGAFWGTPCNLKEKQTFWRSVLILWWISL